MAQINTPKEVLALAQKSATGTGRNTETAILRTSNFAGSYTREHQKWKSSRPTPCRKANHGPMTSGNTEGT
jgi:hypothetical protein